MAGLLDLLVHVLHGLLTLGLLALELLHLLLQRVDGLLLLLEELLQLVELTLQRGLVGHLRRRPGG